MRLALLAACFAVRPAHQEHLVPDDLDDRPDTDVAGVDLSLAELGAEPSARTAVAVEDVGVIAEEVPFSGMASFLDVLSEDAEVRVSRLGWEPVPESGEGAQQREAHQRMRVAALLSTLVGAAVVLRYHAGAVPRFAVELLGLLGLCATVYGAYLYAAFGAAVAQPFAYCVAIELLFGFDNAMDIVGWYTHSGLEPAALVRLVVAGGVIQGVPRLTVLPVLAHSLSHSAVAQRFAAVLLLATAGRNVFVGLTYREPSEAEPKSRLGLALPLAVRILLVELTDFCANADSFFAKTLVTDDELHISLSSLVTLFVPRALALLLLAHQRPKAGAMKVMLLVSGFMLLALAAHIVVPAIPDLPSWFKLAVPAALYGYVFYLAADILARSEPAPHFVGAA